MICAWKGDVFFFFLINWKELRAYFISAELDQSNYDTKFKARLLLKEMMLDYNNYLFFDFAKTVVQQFERVKQPFSTN